MNINQEKLAHEMMTSWIAQELVSCGFPISCPEDLKGLQYAVAQTEIAVVTCDVKKISALQSAITAFIDKFMHYRDEIIRAALVLVLALQVSVQDAVDVELNLERIPG